MSIVPLVETARERLAAVGIPGCAIGILDGGEETVRGLGVTSVEHPLEVDGDTLFQTGSITKTLTGTLAMRLVEEGRLVDDQTPSLGERRQAAVGAKNRSPRAYAVESTCAGAP